MTTDDFETRLRGALHALAPEPPTDYRFDPPEDEIEARTGELIELTPPDDTVGRRRLGPLLAAAAVVALGAGIAAAVLNGHDDAPVSPGSSTTVGPAVRACTNDDRLLRKVSQAQHGPTLVVVLALQNIGRTECTVRPTPRFAVEANHHDPSARSFPAATLPHAGVLPPQAAFRFGLRMTVTDTCAQPGLVARSVTITSDGFRYAYRLPDHCTIRPDRVTTTRTR